MKYWLVLVWMVVLLIGSYCEAADSESDRYLFDGYAIIHIPATEHREFYMFHVSGRTYKFYTVPCPYKKDCDTVAVPQDIAEKIRHMVDQRSTK